MNTIQFFEREMTDAEFARMNAGFDEHTVEFGNPIQASERHGFVVMDGEKFIGCASGLAYKNGADYNGWFYLTDLFIEQEYRGRGLGAAILSKLEAKAASLGVIHFWTETAGYEAPGFYLKQGYSVLFEQENWYATGHSRAALRKRLEGSLSMSRMGETMPDTAAIMGGLYGDGFIGVEGAFSRAWVQALDEDIAALFAEALATPGGAVGRGPNRYYVEIHPERIRGFVELATHPFVTAVSAAILGPDYKIVEIGFDVPLAGAQNQPWHRDFPAPDATLTGRRLNSLAFNLTTVDVHENMGPFEIAPGTQWDAPENFEHGMFPPKSLYPRYQARAQRKLPQCGDISVRSALTIHRGTANHSTKSRPALVLGVDAPDARNAERHDLQFTRAYYETMPDELRRHLTCRVVEKLEPIVQAHTIEGLVMGDA